MRQMLRALCTIAAATSLSAFAGQTTNKIGITMVDIPAGSFVMGSCQQVELTDEQNEENKKRAFLGQALIQAQSGACLTGSPDPDADDRETPQHRVSIRKFQMGKTEVTLGQFKQYITAAGRSDLVDDDFMKYNSNGDNASVVNVSWSDAQDFISWLNDTVGGGYRLPSEAEWEYACHAGGGARYCGGNDLDAVAWYVNNSSKQQHRVGTKKANAFGLYDMSGNVSEWVEDCTHGSYSGAPTDGSVWASSCSSVLRVLRGGCFFDNARYTRAAYRGYSLPDNRGYAIGLRLARTR